MRRAVRFANQDVVDVWVPRDCLRTLQSGHTEGALERLVVETGYSRLASGARVGSWRPAAM